MEQTAGGSELAFIYASPPNLAAMKSLWLIFDGFALVGDPQHLERGLQDEPEFYKPIMDSGLGRWWDPDTFFDEPYRKLHSDVITEIVQSGALDTDKPAVPSGGQRIYMRNLPSYHWPDIVTKTEDGLLIDAVKKPKQPLFELLKEKGLIWLDDLDKSDLHRSDSYRIDGTLRAINSTLIGQFARKRAAERFGVQLQPIDEPSDILRKVLSMDFMPSKGHLIMHDLDVVGPCLELAGIDDLLDFRERHGKEHKAYMRELRQFLAGIAVVPMNERITAVEARHEDLRSQAEELTRIQLRNFKNPSKFLLGIAGAAWAMASHNVPGAVLALAGAFLGVAGDPTTPGAYTYMTAIQRWPTARFLPRSTT